MNYAHLLSSFVVHWRWSCLSYVCLSLIARRNQDERNLQEWETTEVPFEKLDGGVFFNYPQDNADQVTITTQDLNCLAPEEFLNDNIIDFYIK